LTDIQGLYVINPKTKECVLKSQKLSFKSVKEITLFLLRKINGKPLTFDYVEVSEIE